MKKLLFFLLNGLLFVNGYADPGNGIVADKKGNIFYTDLARVWKMDAQGRKTVAVNNVHTHELYIDSAGNLFGEHLWFKGEATNTWGHYVWRLSAAGQLEKIKPDSPGFLEWYSFVRDDAGNMYYREETIPVNFWKIAPSGEKTLLGSLSVRNPGRLHISKKDDLYIPNRDAIYVIRKNDTLKLLYNNFSANAQTEQGKKCERCTEGIFTNDTGELYIAFSSDGTVIKAEPNGTYTVVHRSTGNWYPVGGAFAANGQLWVMEYNAANETRVVKAVPPVALPEEKKAARNSNKIILPVTLAVSVSAAVIYLLARKRKMV